MKRSKIKTKSNKLKQALTSGKSIKGIKGFIHCSDINCYIPISLDRVEIDGCNTYVLGKVAGAVGEVKVTPCQFIDDKQAITDQIEQDRKIQLGQEVMNRIENPRLLTGRRRALLEYVEQMSPKNKELLHHDLQAMGKNIETLQSHEVGEYAASAIQLEIGVNIDVPWSSRRR